MYRWVMCFILMVVCTSNAAAARPKKASFRDTLIEAAEQEREAGKLKPRQVIMLRVATLSPKVCERLQNEVVSRAIKAGKMNMNDAGNIGAFDFTALLEFIKQLMPLILQLIQLFSQDVMHNTQVMLVMDDGLLDEYACGGALLRALRPCNWPLIRRLPAAANRRERIYGTPEIQYPVLDQMRERGACRGGVCPA